MFLILILWALCMPALSLIPTTIYYLDKRKALQAAILIGVAYAAIFYNYIPDSGNDSWRHMALLTNYQNISLWKCFNAGHYSMLYVWDVWNWIIARFHLPFLLPASGAFFGFTIIAYIIFDYCTIIHASARTVVSILILTLMATNPSGYAIGIRSSCAYIICILGIYLSEIRSKNRIFTLILMILAVLIHRSAGLLLVVWLTFPLFKKRPVIMTIVIGCFVLGIAKILNSVLSILPSDGGISQMTLEASNSIDVYQQNSSYNIMMSTSFKSRVELGCSLLYIVSMLFRSHSLFPFLERINNKDPKVEQAYMFKDIATLYLVVSIAMICVLTLNGSRYLQIPEVLAIVPLMFSFQERPFGIIKRNHAIQFATETLILGMSGLHLMLNLYSLAWGDASFNSFLGGALGGVFYALIRTI